MSVILYTHPEIVSMLATCWTRGSAGSTDALRFMEKMAQAGTLISRANADAYNATYTRDPEPAQPFEVTARDIKSVMMRATVNTRREGIRTLDGIRYNLVANNGQDFATAEILDWLLTFMSAARSLAAMGYDKREVA